MANDRDQCVVVADPAFLVAVDRVDDRQRPGRLRLDPRAELRGGALDKIFVRVRPRFAGDSLLEQRGFGPLGPLRWMACAQKTASI
jgi:hypothetical protein